MLEPAERAVLTLVQLARNGGILPSSSHHKQKELHITIPEDLDYEGVFDEIFDKYTSERKLISVKTSDMGSLFRLKYTVTLRNGMSEKDFIDKLRVRNGNLPITVCISQLTESSAQL